MRPLQQMLDDTKRQADADRYAREARQAEKRLSPIGRDFLGFFRVARKLGQAATLNPETMGQFSTLIGLSSKEAEIIAAILLEERRVTSKGELDAEIIMNGIMSAFAERGKVQE